MPENNNGTVNTAYGPSITSATASARSSITVPAQYQSLDKALNDMQISDEQEEGRADGAASQVNTIAGATKRIMSGILVPGATTVSAASIGYVLLFGRTMYSALAMLLGLGLGSQKLDPATLLEYWEREAGKRESDDKKVEGMFS